MISSRIRSCGSRASARARSSMRSIGSGTSSACSAISTSRSSACSSRRTACGRDAGEPKVLSDRQVGDESGILEDRCQPEPRGRGRRGHLDRLAVDGDRPRVRPDHAGEQLDERALARAVGAEQRVHLARLDDERGRAQRDDRAVALGELPGLEEAAAVFAHVGRDRATGDVGGAAGAPPTVVMPLRAPCSS